jgi:hypothetical protein
VHNLAASLNSLSLSTVKELAVHDPGLAWQRMQPRWELIEELIGGTLQLQAAGRRYLLQEPKESDEAYQARLLRSVCPPYVARTEQMLAGMLTRKPVRLDNVPDVMSEQLFDVDLQGNDLNVYANQLARTCIRYGHVGVLVDFPRGDEGDDSPVQDFNRPYWVSYTPRDILGWRTDVVGGTQKLTQLRLLERVVVPFKEFGEELVEQVRVLEVGRFRLYRKQASRSRDWELISEGTTTLDEIPFAVAYSNRTAFMESTPPLEEIAHLNLQSYRVGSDLSNQLHLAAVPRFHLYGVPAELDEITAGPDSAMALPVDARAEFVEPQGTSYGFQLQQLERIEKQIAELGLAAILGQNMTNQAAQSKAIDRSQGDAALMQVALGLQDLIDNCLRFHAAFLNLPSGGSSMVNNDFVAKTLEPAHVQQLIQLRNAGDITQETLLIQLADGEWLYDDFNVDAEIEATAAQQQSRLEATEQQLQGALQELPSIDRQPTEQSSPVG